VYGIMVQRTTKSWERYDWATRLVITIAMVLTRVLSAAAASYQFVNIVDDSGPFDTNDFGGASINNSGVVAFKGARDGVHGIYTGSGGAITTIADMSGPYNGVSYSASINDAGVVAFAGGLDTGGQGIFTSSGGPTNPIVDSSGPFASFDPPAINNGGTLAFLATLDGGQSGIYASDGGAATTIADLGGDLSFIGFDLPAINNNGTVAFFAARSLGGGGGGFSQGTGIFTGNGGPVNTIHFAISASGVFGTPSINDSEELAYPRHTSGSATIYAYSAGTPNPFVMTNSSGPFLGLENPHVNSAGDIAFQGYVFQPTEGWGIFTGPNPATDKVIQTGDTLFGSTVTSVDLSLGRRLNDRGDVVFGYGLASGVVGIAVARVSLPGDYNQNGVVDAADYTVWRDSLSSTTDLRADGNGNGMIDSGDYSVWKANYGNHPGSATGSSATAAVAEPGTLLLLVLGMLTICPCRRAKVS
jgi:hypothetical protein